MTDKKWSDYWERHKVKTSKLSKKLSFPKVNKQLILLVASLIAIIILGFLNFRTGNYAKILENDIIDLENQMSSYEEESQEFSSSLDTCKADLAVCQTNVSSKVTALERCEEEKNMICPSGGRYEDWYLRMKESYIQDKCCQQEGVYKSYNIGNDMEIICRTDELGLFELEC